MSKIIDGDLFKTLAIGASFVALILVACRQVIGQPNIESNLEPLSCDAEDNLRSLSSRISTNIRFVNRKNFRVKVYWIDFRGKRQHYFDLAPNGVRDQQTFVSHPWLVTEAGENQPCIKMFLPNQKPKIAIVD
jgi:VHL beta domain